MYMSLLLRMRIFEQNLQIKSKHIFNTQNTFSENRGKILYSRTGCTLRAGYLRLQTHMQNMKYLLLSQGNDDFANAPQCCVHMYTRLLFTYPAMRTSNFILGLMNSYWSEPPSQTEFWSRGRKFTNVTVIHATWPTTSVAGYTTWVLAWRRLTPSIYFESALWLSPEQ
jgi:hypothetical protein